MQLGGVNLFVAFAAGLVSILSPCVLPLVPIYLAYLTGSTAEASEMGGRSRAGLFHSIAFTGGFSLVLIILGASVGVVGYFFQDHLGLLTKIAGVLMIVMGLHMARIFRIPLLDRDFTLQYEGPSRAGYVRSFSVGAAYSVGWSPCIGPTLGAVLTLASTSGNVPQATVLLAVYALGFSVPFIAAGAAIGGVQRFMKAIAPQLPRIEFASGLVLVAVGVLVFSGALVQLNQYFSGFAPSINL
ncbi:MAG: cytochrome c biogenesis protein CcdA [Chloroflexota bacterium]|nr:cytochrome c biogenesis protein CcdA [Chloroflexota bacterium]